MLDSTLERTREPLGFTRPSHAPSTMPDPGNPDRDEADINAMLDLLDKGEVSVLALCDCTKRSLQSLADLLESELCQRAFNNFERIYQARHRLVELRKKFVADAALVRIAAASPLSHREAECVRKSANKLFEEHRKKSEHTPAPVAPTSSPTSVPPEPTHPPISPISLPILDLPTPANRKGRCPRTGPASAAASILNHTGSAMLLPASPRGADFQSAFPSQAAPTPAVSAARSERADRRDRAVATHAGSAASHAPTDHGDHHNRTMMLASSP